MREVYGKLYKIEDLLKAKPIDAPDKAEVKWRKIKKFRIRRYTHATQKHEHPGTELARSLLEEAGRDLKVCQECEGIYRICVHHLDDNPYNNELANLQVLCWPCHQKKHDPSGIICEDLEVPLDEE